MLHCCFSDADTGIEAPSQIYPTDFRCLHIANNKDADLRFLLLQKVEDEKDTFERIAQGVPEYEKGVR
jgi:hypothetical protein